MATNSEGADKKSQKGDAVHHTKLQQNTNPLMDYAAKHSLHLIPAQQKLIDITLQDRMSIMLSSADQQNMLQGLCIAIGAKKTLDIGVYTGYSALSIALVLPDDGKVVACDISDEWAKVGKPFWKEAGVEHKIDFICGPAADTLQRLIDEGQSETFDFAFIDADKPNYLTYYELTLKLLRKRGVVCFDNMLWGGKVCDPEAQDAYTCALREVAAKLHSDPRVHTSLVTVGDGTLIAVKL